MAEYTLVEAPALNAVKASLNGDGTGTFWANSWLPLWGQFSAVKKYVKSDYAIDFTKSLDGTASGNGAALVGMPASTGSSWAGGTLFSFLDGLLGRPLKISGTNAGIRYRTPTLLPDADTTLTLNTDFYFIDTLSAARTYTLPAPDSVGQTVTISMTSAGGFTANIKRSGDPSNCASIFGAIAPGVGFVKLVADTGPTWRPIEFGGQVGVETYP